MGLITSWSFSRWNAYEECPFKARLKFVDKLTEPSGPALERGTALHRQAELYLIGDKKAVPKDLRLISKELKELRTAGAVPEAEFAFNDRWEKVEWFAKDAWLRVKADAVVPPIIDAKEPTVRVDDFKSGGKLDTKTGTVLSKEEYPLQLELYDLAGLLAYPVAEKAVSRLLFIDHGKVVASEETRTRSDVKRLQKTWVTRTARMLRDTQFKPTPGNYCRWCHFRRANDGPCKY